MQSIHKSSGVCMPQFRVQYLKNHHAPYVLGTRLLEALVQISELGSLGTPLLVYWELSPILKLPGSAEQDESLTNACPG